MYSIERISNCLASKISSKLKLDKDHEEVLAYGAFSLFQTIWSIILIILVGIATHALLEAFTISIAAAVLRKYSGGAHATGPNRCAVIGMIAANGLGILVNRSMIHIDLMNAIFFEMMGFIFIYYIVNKYAPVDTPNKPIRKEEKRRRLKGNSLRVIHIALTIVGILIFMYLRTKNDILLRSLLSIGVGLVWQGATLTYLGHVFIKVLDKFLKKLYI